MTDWAYTFTADKGPQGLAFGDARPYFDRVVSSIPNGVKVRIRLDEWQDKRTHAQNRLAWGTVYDQLIDGLVTAGFYEPHERKAAKDLIHEGLCAKYGGTVTDKVTGQQVRVFRTSKATKQQFSEFIEWVARFAATEYGIVITLPGEAA